MTKETFLLLYVAGSAAIAVWFALCVPRIAPRSMRAAGVHIALALMLGFVLSPALRLVPGQPGKAAMLVALFCVALPVLTYMLLSGLWLLQLFAGDPLAKRR